MSAPITTGVFEKLGVEAAFPMAVPTCSVIIFDENDPYRVAVIEHAEKHNGRLTCVGGKLTGNITPEQCACDEGWQEAGARFETIRPFAIKSDRFADVRVVTLNKATDGLCSPELANTKVLAMYGCPDHWFTATVDGSLRPVDGEAKRVIWIDTRKIVLTATPEESVFGAQHDLLLVMYRHVVDGCRSHWYDLSDMAALRSRLLEAQEDDRAGDAKLASLTARSVLETAQAG